MKCIFTSYSLESKAYRLYDHVAKKIIISKDLEFIEIQSWDCSVDESVRTSSKVQIIDQEDEVSDHHDEATINIDSSK